MQQQHSLNCRTATQFLLLVPQVGRLAAIQRMMYSSSLCGVLQAVHALCGCAMCRGQKHTRVRAVLLKRQRRSSNATSAIQ